MEITRGSKYGTLSILFIEYDGKDSKLKKVSLNTEIMDALKILAK